MSFRPVSSNGAENRVKASSLLNMFSILLKNKRYMDEEIWLPGVLQSLCGCVRTESALSSAMEISLQPFMQAIVFTSLVTDDV